MAALGGLAATNGDNRERHDIGGDNLAKQST
jgi:hypothetical protein